MPKRSVRQAMLSRRKALSVEEYHRASLRIQQSFLGTPQYQQSSCIIVYAPIHNEVATDLVVRHALDAGKRVGFPVVVGKALVFREVRAGLAMQQGAFGILEPCPGGSELLPEEADILVLPGVAFDVHGHRIGYGKGYYDKTVHHVEGKGKLFAFCFEFQIVETIVGQSHDVKMDYIITEQRIISSLTRQVPVDRII